MPKKPSNLKNLNELTELEEKVIWFKSKTKKKGGENTQGENTERRT
jgi:hypothetical protein